MRLSERLSPNHNARPGGRAPDLVVLHYTGMRSAAEALERLCDPAAQVSAHYLIEEDGRVWHLVPEERRAWHAGLSCWQGERDVNGLSVGIELVNPGHEFGYRAFPPAQMEALATLLDRVVRRCGIPPRRIVGHADVAPARKQDPGELFDWAALAADGFGLWTEAVLEDRGERFEALGYDPKVAPEDVIRAFQRHWRPARVDGLRDPETGGRLAALLQAAGPDFRRPG